MAKLRDEQKEQCRSMFKDGKQPKDIIEFFKTNYNIKLGSSTLSYILHGRKKQEKLMKKSSHEKLKIAKIIPIQETPNDEFALHIKTAFVLFKKRFLKEVEAVISEEKI